MSQILIKSLIKCLIDTLIALESAGEDTIGEDLAVQLLEQMSYHLQNLTAADKTLLINEIIQVSKDYPTETQEFIKSIPENFGVTIN